jgi:predicted  nucleic acid-binding Zn-ribbon protein
MKDEQEKVAARPALGVDSGQRATRRKPPAGKAKDERRKVAELQELENKISALEKQLAELGSQLEHPPAGTEQVTKLGNEYAALQREMDEKLGEWERIQD